VRRATGAEGNIVTEENLPDNPTLDETPAVSEDAPVQYGVGPFSIREVALGGVWLLAFVFSFFSISTTRFDSVWTAGIWWILTIGIPTVAVFLIALRRLSPDGIRRVGSLGIDQFASVAFSVSALVWITWIWETVGFVIQGGPWVRSWVIWVEAVLMLAGIVLTVLAPFIPVLGEDFRLRPEIAAHRNARPLRPVTKRPPRERRPAPVTAASPNDADPYASAAAGAYADPYGSPYTAETGPQPNWTGEHATQHPVDAGHYGSGSTAEADRTAVYDAAPATEPVRHQAFWALAHQERDVVDETGAPVWRIGPEAWALVIEDRGDVFVMRHEDGRVGYLHDVRDITRG
jgi:hypothetical protein